MATFAFGAVVGTSLAGCPTDSSVDGGEMPDVRTFGDTPVYGSPDVPFIPTDAGSDAGGVTDTGTALDTGIDTGIDTGGIAPAYGAPPK